MEMTVDMFQVIEDPQTQSRYVKKVKDEMTKNHKQIDDEIVTGFMPEIPGNHMCPVKSFEKYVSHLHPEGSFLWQSPIRNPSTNVWYGPRRLGIQKMRHFMQNLSAEAQLTRKYTNHDIRVTGCSILTRAKYSNKQIASITGHRSMQSLAIYQHVSTDEKLMMGVTLNCALLAPETIPNAIQSEGPKPKKKRIALPCATEAVAPANNDDDPPPPPPTMPMQAIAPANAVPVLDDNTSPEEAPVPIAEDLFNLLSDLEKQSAPPVPATTSNNQINNTQINVAKSPAAKVPFFNNCSIGTVNFQIIQK